MTKYFTYMKIYTLENTDLVVHRMWEKLFIGLVVYINSKVHG